MNPWQLTEDVYSPTTALAWEGLFTVGSGYLHVRGSLEEHLADAPQNRSWLRMPGNVTAESFSDSAAKWGTYVPGVFAPHPTLNDEMVNLPWFLELIPIVDGERLDITKCRIVKYRRTLDLRRAVLSRKLTWHTTSGVQMEVAFDRFVSAAQPSLCVQSLTLRSDRPARLQVRAGIDGDVRTSGFDHLVDVDVRCTGPHTLACHARTNGEETISIVSALMAEDADWRFDERHRGGSLVTDFELRADTPFSVRKLSAVETSRDPRPRPAAAVVSAAAGLKDDVLRREHVDQWQRWWATSDVVIDGDSESQLALRTSIYHLLRVLPRDDSRIAIDAKGAAGDAYFGRYFWDTEMYLLPFYLYTQPQRTRGLVDFRVETLDGAHRNARRYGYEGARYAWESDILGDERCPNWQYADHEVHVTADVVYGLAHYAAAVDEAYILGPAAAVVAETARYWLDRIDYRPGERHPSLLGVMGPDEYTPISSNNAYTNRLVSFALQLAAGEAGAAGGADDDERRRFAQVADGLPILRRDDGLVLQCEEFEALADPRFDALWLDRSRGFASQVSQERLYRSRCLKQADVVMLMALFPHEFNDAEVRQAWDFYLPYTTHDSSLSVGIHALVALRLGLADAAWHLWEQARSLDLDVDRGGAAQGIHIAGCGCNWMVAINGFAGMQTALQSDILTLNPRLPKQWQRLAFKIVWRGAPMDIDIDAQGCRVTNNGRQPVTASVHDRTATIMPGSTHVFDPMHAI